MENLAALIIRVRDGDAEAFSLVVHRFQDMAVGYSYALLRDLSLAEDAAQEAFLEAYLCLSNLREPAAFPGWFRRIVFKQCDRITRGRSAVFEPLRPAQELPSPHPNQVAVMEQREMKDQVWEAIDSLPEHEREAVILFYIGGYSQREVSEFLGATAPTIRKRLFSARRRMREMLMEIVADSLRSRRPSRDESFAASVMEMLTAARTGDTKRVGELLRENRLLLTARDWLGNTPLIMAVNSGHSAVAELLFNAEVQPDIHEAAAIGLTERVADLLREDTSRLDLFSAEGFTPLGLAAHFGHRETTEYLLARGANAGIVSLHPLQVTPLQAALYGRQTETARLLIEGGADVNTQRGGKGWPRAGWTALHYAAGYGMIEMIELLLAYGADLNTLDDDGRTPLAVAIEEKQEQAVELLRQKQTQD